MGRETLGRIMNVIGEPVDECGPISELGQPHKEPACTCLCACLSAIMQDAAGWLSWLPACVPPCLGPG